MTVRGRFRGAAIAVLALVSLAGCSGRNGQVRGSGTIEMDEIDVASLVGGRLARIAVVEGDTVRAGDTLAVLDRGEISAELAAQAALVQRAQAETRDLREGARPPEVLAARADLAAAEADRDLAQRELDRIEPLAKSQVVAPAELDRSKAARDAAAARARAAAERLRLLEAGFRRQQISAAQGAAVSAIAQLAGARSRANELVLAAPSNGVVLLKNYQPGELVPPSMPVVTLGDPDRLWIRVYVAAPLLSRVKLGAAVDVTPIGAKTPYRGRVIEIASRAEFTPRAALTEEEQANLVFGVKIALDPTGGALKAGLPADAHIHTSP